MLTNKNKQYIFLFILAIIFYILFLIIRPFMSAIFASFVLTFALYPLYKLINKKIKNNVLSAAILTLIVLLLIIVPFAFSANIVAKESVVVYNQIKSRDFSLLISKYFADNSGELLKTVIDRASFFLVTITSQFILSLPSIILSFFVMIFLTYYLFKDGERFVEIIKKLLPLKSSTKERLSNKFTITTKALIYGILFTAIVQGIIAGIGFYIFNISSPLLLAFVTIMASLIPFIGTALVWFPIGIFQIISGNVFNGLGLIIYGSLIISTIDNFIKPKFIEKKANIHPAIVLLGLLGGIKVFGFMGIFIGPLFLTLIVEMFKIRSGDSNEVQSS